jgi:hypothetical protein
LFVCVELGVGVKELDGTSLVGYGVKDDVCEILGVFDKLGVVEDVIEGEDDSDGMSTFRVGIGVVE